ncbi:hypothetical protein LP417_35155 (plasmid) [Polaromonas sp. P1-6]|nr:hypothetical protein LP417_35155 [Polaromonas sp. P1-6]
MSQHTFETTHKSAVVTVLLGWDRPLQEVFMVIENNDAKDDEDDFLYSNLSDADSIGKDMSYYKEKLKQLGITVPETMFEQIAVDQQNNAGNRYCLYQPDGAFAAL